MRKRDLTPEDLRSYTIFMQQRFGFRLLDKECQADLKEIADAVALLGVGDPHAYLRRYAFTVGTLVGTPFEPGVPLENWPLEWQFYTVGHEGLHAHRYLNGGRERWQQAYLLDAEFRALEELHAYSVNMELHFLLTGEVLDAQRLANALTNYACNPAQIEMVKQGLDQRFPAIVAGALIEPTSQAAAEWARANGLV